MSHETGAEHDDAVVARCPACGHELSMYEDAEVGRAEAIATAIAERVASWWFAGLVGSFLGVWIAVNVAARPFEPYPVVMLAVISAVLATVAALQGPLILLTQRRAAERDRARDREALMVAVNAETDIHRVEAKLDRLTARLAGVSTDRDD
ncbi:MAG: DUF1003 domain-containing protein [Ilumatobacter sp.]|uniref:DUF1003 domain-containing protein n=1 Tax=Ilumatobacter sp. TaxID=1967498 RepID=UPI0026371187|nr:DUF1003 domain-containing protein [Ilumatobacter sp.]MDJ0771743.1 DUF1003 domain-containing protein [Ilumatobacter sp.]